MGGRRAASCCSERSSNREGFWSSKLVPRRAVMNSILAMRTYEEAIVGDISMWLFVRMVVVKFHLG